MKRYAMILIVFVLANGCTAAIRPRPPLPVPPNLSQSDVEVVILFDLANQPLPTEFSHGERIADNALKAVLGWRYHSAAPNTSMWFPESVESGVIYAGYQVRTHYLRAAIQYNAQTVTTRIVDSKNLNQKNGRIHPNAFVWMDQLETRIRRALGNASAAKKLAEEPRQ